jgi:hypothetical protein
MEGLRFRLSGECHESAINGVSFFGLAPANSCQAVAFYAKARTRPSAHVLSRLTLNHGMFLMGMSGNWPIGPRQAEWREAISPLVHDMLTGKYDERTGDTLTDRLAQSFGP